MNESIGVNPHRRAAHEFLVTRAIDQYAMSKDEIRAELQRAGLSEPTDLDVQKVLDSIRAGDRERALDREAREK
ncbi:hypothetical protein C5C66_09090 [Rathayibacter toxicus]|uniref:Uncharacterized protein n=1 Tax=Rathayibacter toxicus TaxID=145458 RepID=A0A0C5BFH6_9MICO|nr:hypothetical protein [Rathayibacter toxicus]AJM78071.1 hypothetical protein TI83_09235 [Rathayibacter toxicus]ALS57689.1 hypothetical protein APU90_07840 [Rathayibacter toxicus]KKM45028.1 hypothetical protein VT73_07995 [Rathayibacter toxicus]PPG20639.1 hypothetical protein C5D15_09080 [Rathayibacter toxicus]PPG45742.1 hypothetical protein C5D16_09045 [Rathayibacter toxicus]